MLCGFILSLLLRTPRQIKIITSETILTGERKLRFQSLFRNTGISVLADARPEKSIHRLSDEGGRVIAHMTLSVVELTHRKHT
jgi:hypothetical protein